MSSEMEWSRRIFEACLVSDPALDLPQLPQYATQIASRELGAAEAIVLDLVKAARDLGVRAAAGEQTVELRCITGVLLMYTGLLAYAEGVPSLEQGM